MRDHGLPLSLFPVGFNGIFSVLSQGFWLGHDEDTKRKEVNWRTSCQMSVVAL